MHSSSIVRGFLRSSLVGLALGCAAGCDKSPPPAAENRLENPAAIQQHVSSGITWPAPAWTGTNSVQLFDRVVITGDVALTKQATGATLGGAELVLAANARITGNVQADTITMASGATITGNATYNSRSGGTVGGTASSPLALPLSIAVPALPTVTPGTQNVTLNNNATQTLAAGSYKDVLVKNGNGGGTTVLTLSGGTFHFEDVTLENDARLRCSASCQVRIQGRLTVGDRSKIEPTSGVGTGNMEVFVKGGNSASDPNSTPSAAQIGNDSTLRAYLLAPNGTLRLGDRAVTAGKVVARDVRIGHDGDFDSEPVAVITTQPANVTATAGTQASFSVVATGTGLSYQWKKNGTNVAGATSATLSFGPTQASDNGALFTVVITNVYGSVTSAAATLTVTTNLCAGVTCTALSQCHGVGTCAPATGICSHPVLPNGTTCNDGNGATTSDQCTGGSCAGVDLCAGVTCTALDPCHVAGTCDSQTGACSNPNAANGATCNDGNASTANDQCTDGMCNGVNLCAGVTCTALDQCHGVGACAPATGLCSNPLLADGVSCDDGNASTTSDQCTSGSCAGVDLCAGVTCAALDQCHSAGTCDFQTGACDHPALANGTTCNDGNGDTTSDQCTDGTCAGTDLCAGVTCTASDQCHAPGACDHQTGACSDPLLPNGTSCDDQNPVTTSDECAGGTCVGVDLCASVTCTASDQCHEAGTCDYLTGACSDPELTDGTSCDDEDPTTTSDECTSGLCLGTDLCDGVTCTASDQCHVAGTCDYQTGSCSNPNAPSGTTCDDDDEQTVSDECTSGLCLGTNLCEGVTCAALDQCHVAGTCDHQTGACSNPNAANGATCSDGNPDTTGDVCTAGSCAGVDLCATVTCAASDQCHIAGTCDHQTGACSNPNAPSGTTCSDGNPDTTSDQCTAGSCAGVDLCATVTCAASDQCHAAGTCDHQTGTCSDPELPDGTTCDDEDEQTVSDECTIGLCAGTNLCEGVTCTASDQCHATGTCDYQTGDCDDPARPNGASCDDADADTTSDQCTNGVCSGIDLCEGVICTASDQCHEAGTCNQGTGICTDPALPNGTACNDANSTTSNDQCTSGTCAGVDLCAGVTCPVVDQCNKSFCDHATGQCGAVVLLEGQTCEDTNVCTIAECRASGCVTIGTRVDSIRTSPSDPCRVEACNPSSGTWQPAGVNISANCGAGGYCSSQGLCVEPAPNEGSLTELPPMPPELDPLNADQTQPLDFAAHAATYYAGENPHQERQLNPTTGVPIPIVIEAQRAALISGVVWDESGAPLAGVQVTVKNKPEYGVVHSDVNGRYDMAIEGGGPLVVRLELAGYLTADRAVDAAWHAGDRAADTVLLPMPSGDDVVDVSDATGMDLIADGPESSEPENPDDPLARVPHLFIPQGLQVQPTNSSPVPVVQIGFKEFTEGDPAAMPAALPATSAYTYAIELLALDENGNDMGGVDFKRNGLPVEIPFYVNNFMRFPVGARVPLGYYDTNAAVWVPAKTGTVLKVMQPGAGGEYRLSENCTDDDDETTCTELTPARITALGLTAAELDALEITYGPGEELWRLQMGHFTRWDANMGTGAPDCDPTNSSCPGETGGSPQSGPGPEPDKDSETCGSIIRVESQTLSEQVELAGTPYSLMYHSDRAPGYLVDQSVRVPTKSNNGKDWGDAYLGTDIVLQVGGQSQRFSATKPIELVTWNGELPNGPQNAQVTVIQKWKGGYSNPNVFGAVAGSSASGFGAEYAGRTTVRGNRNVFQLIREFDVAVGGWQIPAPEFGGWGLDMVHAYSPDRGLLYRGDGSVETGRGYWVARGTTEALEYFTTGPDGSEYIYRNEGGPRRVYRRKPKETSFSVFISNLTTLLPAGTSNTFVDDMKVDGQNRLHFLLPYSTSGGANWSGIWRFEAGGLVLVAGFQIVSSPPNNLQRAIAFDIDKDGNFVTTTANCFVNRISAAGVVTYEPAFPNTGSAQGCRDIAVGPDGSIYRTEAYAAKVLRPDGRLQPLTKHCDSNSFPFCGNVSTPTGDVLAKDATLRIMALDADRFGNVFVATVSGGVGQGCRVYRIDPEGVLHLVAGVVGSCSNGAVTPTPATSASLPLNDTVKVSVLPNGEILLRSFAGSTTYHRIFRRGATLSVPGDECTSIGGGWWVPSDDGTERYCFTAAGRHLGTWSAVAGIVQLLFEHDPDGLVTRIRDRRYCPAGPLAACPAANATQITRSPDEIQVLSPGGHPTTISLDDGYADQFRFPSGTLTPGTDVIDVTHDPSTGFLTAMTKGAGYESHFYEYDDVGRLISDTDPNGGQKALARLDVDANIFETRVTQTSGQETKYRTTNSGTNVTQLITSPTGEVTSILTDRLTGAATKTRTDGTITFGQTTHRPENDEETDITTTVTAPLVNATPLTTTTSRRITRTTPSQQITTTTAIAGVTSTVVHTDATPTVAATRVTRSLQNRVLTETLDAHARTVKSEWTGAGAPLPVFTTYDTCSPGKVCSIRQGTRLQTFEYTNATLSRVTAYATDANGNNPVEQTVVEYENDAFGRPLVTTQEPGTIDEITTQTEWDIFGNLATVTPPGKPTHFMMSNGLGLDESYVAPYIDDNYGTGETFKTYDKARRLETVSYPDGTLLRHNHNTAGQLTQTAFDFLATNYTYYPCTGDARCGKLQTASGPYGITTTYNYANFFPSAVTTNFGPFSKVLNFTFDARHRRRTTFITGATPGAETLTYDNDSLITCLSAGACSAGNARIQYTLDPVVPRVTTVAATAPTGETLNDAYTYNTFGQVETYSMTGALTPFALAYTHDALGRIETVAETSNGAAQLTKRYEYDEAGRLYREYPDESDLDTFEEWTYDANGNRDCAEGPASYDEQDRMLVCNGTEYTYDDNGSLTSRGADTFEYDILGNLLAATVTVAAVPTTVTYAVDAENRRVGRTVNGVTTRYVYEDQLRIAAELDATGNVVSQFYYRDSPNSPEMMWKNGVWYRVVTDHLGSVRQVIDEATGAVAFAATYSAWGERTVTVGSDTFIPHGFAGGLHDSATGLVRFGARDYDPLVGRWTAKDPIRWEGGQENLYGYVELDPVNHTDPEGLEADGECEKKCDDTYGPLKNKCWKDHCSWCTDALCKVRCQKANCPDVIRDANKCYADCAGNSSCSESENCCEGSE